MALKRKSTIVERNMQKNETKKKKKLEKIATAGFRGDR